MSIVLQTDVSGGESFKEKKRISTPGIETDMVLYLGN
jgi:hypothetical protein